MTDLDRDPASRPPEPAGSVSDLHAPRATPPSKGSTGAAARVPPDAVEASGRTVRPAGAATNPTMPAEGDPQDLPRDEVPPVGSIVPDDLPSEEVNVPDPDGPDESVDPATGDAGQLHTSGL